MEKLDFIRKFKKDAEIVDTEQAGNAIPGAWKAVFAEKDFSARKNKLMTEWKKIVGELLPESISFIENNLAELDLVRYSGKYSIYYGIKNGEGEVNYFEGGNPMECEGHKLLSGMPEELKAFYTKLHNGFFYFLSRDMGFVPLDKAVHFSEEEWEILEELDEPLQISLETTYGFFKNSSGDFIAIDYENCEGHNAVEWYDTPDLEPDYNMDLWSEADTWLKAGME